MRATMTAARRCAIIICWLAIALLCWAAGYLYRATSTVPLTFTTLHPPYSAPSDQQPVTRQLTPIEQISAIWDEQGPRAASYAASQFLRNDPQNLALSLMLAETLHAASHYRRALAILLPLMPNIFDSTEMQQIRSLIIKISSDYETKLFDGTSEMFAPSNGSSNATDRVIEHLAELSFYDPTYDGHRLRRVHWLIADDQLSAADRLLRETGVEGVSDADREAAHTALNLARNELQITRNEGSLSTFVRIDTAASNTKLALTIDTGATMTAIDEATLQRLGVPQLNEHRVVQTANGRVRLSVYELNDVQIGALKIPSLKVLGLRSPPLSTSGLLGMDIISRLPEPLEVN